MDVSRFDQAINHFNDNELAIMRGELAKELMELEVVLDWYIVHGMHNSIHARSLADAMENVIQQPEIIDQHIDA